MEHLKMETPNGSKLNIDALYQICPSCFTESKQADGTIQKVVDFKKLKELLGEYAAEDAPEFYEFTWVGKQNAKKEAAAPTTKTLRPCPEESVDWDTTQNLYIEGDNLEVLKILQTSYMNQVKMIYIDPPYNTGNDFVYHDDFAISEEEYNEHLVNEEGERFRKNTDSNGRFHSDWCSSFYSRLAISRTLLRNDGVIFISIDEHELQNILKIGDEIFGDSNYIGTISVENNPKGRKNSSFISVSSEYCVIYAKDKKLSYFIENIPKKVSDMTLDENGRYVHNSGKRVLVGENNFNDVVRDSSSEKNYSVYFKKETNELYLKKELYGEDNIELLDKGFVKYYSYNNGKLVENTYTGAKFIQLFNEQALEFSNGKVYEKNFSDTIRIKSLLINREYEAIVNGRKQMYSTELTTTGAGTYLKELFNTTESPFSAPKNIGFLKILISLFPLNNEDDFLIMDFYSGSSTTADAVIQLNKKDNGNRKFIMVQYPENLEKSLENADTLSKKTIKTALSICDHLSAPHTIPEIAKERIRRAGAKIKAEHPNVDTGFRVFKCDSSNMKDVYFAPKDYNQGMLDFMEDNIKEDRSDLDLLFDCMLRMGIKLSMPIKHIQSGNGTIHNVNDGDMVACFNTNITEEIIDAITEMHPLKVVFRDSGFTEASEKMNLFELFKQKCKWDDEEVKNNIKVI